MPPRIRSIRPEIWDDEKFGQLSMDEQLLFIFLISHADDEGRGRASAAYIRSKWQPYKDVKLGDIERWLSTLASKQIAIVYQYCSVSIYHLPGWMAHQKIDRPRPSLFPPPDAYLLEEHAAQLSFGEGSATAPRTSLDCPKGDMDMDRDKTPPYPPPTSNGKESAPEGDEAAVVVAYYLSLHPRARRTSEKLRKVRARLKEGFSADELKQAIRGNAHSEWHVERGKHELEFVLRNASQVERFVEMDRRQRAASPAAKVAAAQEEREAPPELAAMLERERKRREEERAG